MKHPRNANHGSALLIVLGLLGFLLISAVAFSVSMRTEKSAAAAYRNGLIARELLATVFSEARYAVDLALDDQLNGADPFNSPSARTAERLAPFYEGEGSDKYARLIASAPKGANGGDDIAYLLDDAVLRHVPTALAYTVYRILEQDYDQNGTAGTDNAADGYYFDKAARWQTIDIARPERRVSVGNTTDRIRSETIGRMAWAAINVSDMLDINAVGSLSPRRGIGFTGSEFAFGELAGATSSGSGTTAAYDLFQDPGDGSKAKPSDLPLFASGADLALYAARSDGAILTQDDGEVYPFSWEDAVNNEGDGAYSPFTVYSFWPDETRRREDGTNPRSADAIACSDVDQAYLGSMCPQELSSAVEQVLGSSGTSLAENFYLLLRDYVDTDFVPGEAASSNQTIPTAEPVPMVSEVGYQSLASQASTFESAMKQAIEQAFGNREYDGTVSEQDLTSSSGPLSSLKNVKDLTFTFPLDQLALKTFIRTYFPGYAVNPGVNFSIVPEGFASVYVTGFANTQADKQFVSKSEPQTAEFAAISSLTPITGGNGALFETRNFDLKPASSAAAVELDGSQIPMELPSIDPATKEPTEPKATKLTLNCLVDFLFRVGIQSDVPDDGNAFVDLAPCHVVNGGSNPPSDSLYPAESASDRVLGRRLSTALLGFDCYYFRVTRPVSVTFYVRWKAEKEGDASQGQQQYKASLELAGSETGGGDINVSGCLGNPTDFDLGGTKVAVATGSGSSAYNTLSPEAGAWFTVDPRYNWLPPMMGVSDDAASYGLSGAAIIPCLSSPHWLFVENATVGTATEDPSQVQQDYATLASDQSNGWVPFLWGLTVQDIRYGYGNSGQLLLPQEVGFLPVPLADNVWTPTNVTSYGGMSIANYFNNVGKGSFFRTIPVTDFDDDALSKQEYERYGNLCTMFGRFGGENLPEEHRGIMSAFVGMDDYYLSQRLKRFAMMGIPSSIQQAAKVTVDRLTEASSDTMLRVPSEIMDDLKTLQTSTESVQLDTEAKYDEFVRDYLFYLPDDTVPDDTVAKSGTNSWDEDQKAYDGDNNPQPPVRPQTITDVILQRGTDDSGASTNLFTDKLKAYNKYKGSADKLGQNDLTTLVAVGNSCFGDRQQLFLYIMRADTIKTSSSSTSRSLAEYRPQSTARAVALVWRDAYGRLPERVIYFQYLP